MSEFIRYLFILVLSLSLIIVFINTTRVIEDLKIEIIDLRSLCRDVEVRIEEVESRLSKLERMKVVKAVVTAYSPNEDECDDTPYETAFLKRVNPKYVAVSRDLIELGWSPGSKIYIEGVGIRTIGDLMSPRIDGYAVDLFVWNKSDAREIGRSVRLVALLTFND